MNRESDIYVDFKDTTSMANAAIQMILYNYTVMLQLVLVLMV